MGENLTIEKQIELLRKENERLNSEKAELLKIINSTSFKKCQRKTKTAEEFIKKNTELIQKNLEIKNEYQVLIKEAQRIKKNLEMEYRKIINKTINAL